jgi:hypothetical protein
MRGLFARKQLNQSSGISLQESIFGLFAFAGLGFAEDRAADADHV